ncbi:MAG TPA: NAD-binding protein [Phycisphaerales bacterium]|nr:NAD-binding protein [Phycisphaerales bacterium]
MEHTDPANLRIRPPAARRFKEHLFREWCFLVAIIRHRGLSVLLMFAVLAIGSEVLWYDQPLHDGPRPPLFERVYSAWSLMFGQPPAGELPSSWLGRAMLFVIPILGITVIVEAIVEISSMVRDRRSHEESWCTIMSRSMNDHIILVGLGKLGYRTFTILRRLGHSVVVVEASDRNKFLDEVRADGSPILIGDARRDEMLVKAGVEHAASIILATSDDLVNLEAALDARRMNPSIRVVLRMFDQQLADKVGEGFSITGAMSQSAISAPAFATAAVAPSVVGSVIVSGELLIMVRRTISATDPLCGLTIGDLLTRHAVNIIEHTPLNHPRRLFPPPTTRLAPGDTILLQGEFENITKL